MVFRDETKESRNVIYQVLNFLLLMQLFSVYSYDSQILFRWKKSAEQVERHRSIHFIYAVHNHKQKIFTFGIKYNN